MSSSNTEKKMTLPPTLKRHKTIEDFQASSSIYKTMTEPQARGERGAEPTAVNVLYLGIAIAPKEFAPRTYQVAIAVHDGTYSMDFAVYDFESTSATANDDRSKEPVDIDGLTLTNFIVNKIDFYRKTHLYKISGAGITSTSAEICPDLPSRLWADLDIVALTLKIFSVRGSSHTDHSDYVVDEQSDAVVRMALKYFGPNNQPRLEVEYPNEVSVDCGTHAQIVSLAQLQSSVKSQFWDAAMHYATSLHDKRIRIAFFNSTPQGGGVALMRHALIRFMRLAGVDCKWYVPRPKPEIFRITKNNHNILQGVAGPDDILTDEAIAKLDEWCRENAQRYWTKRNRALASRADGGADIVVIDDPQMPMLVDIAKKLDPTRPVIFRSHIQVRADLANDPTSRTHTVWNWIWNHVKNCDVFISHPVRQFIPDNVTLEKVGYMPATTDWLDGLNKRLSQWDAEYYLHEFFLECHKHGMYRLQYPDRPYIAQVARFDPAKGIPHVLESYAQLRRRPELMGKWSTKHVPQLLICGHGAIDDPDATLIYDETIKAINDKYPELKEDIIVMRLGPTDQILNVLLAHAHVALQLSTREGFEVKVSEALHHGVPVIATRTGGIPLQVQHEETGFLVDPGTPEVVGEQVSQYLFSLFEDDVLRGSMAYKAASGVSDEVSTIGNALAWMYLADELAKGVKVEPRYRWINDMAREKAGMPFDEIVETRLAREGDLASD